MAPYSFVLVCLVGDLRFWRVLFKLVAVDGISNVLMLNLVVLSPNVLLMYTLTPLSLSLSLSSLRNC